jgi:hypothetical protein
MGLLGLDGFAASWAFHNATSLTPNGTGLRLLVVPALYGVVYGMGKEKSRCTSLDLFLNHPPLNLRYVLMNNICIGRQLRFVKLTALPKRGPTLGELPPYAQMYFWGKSEILGIILVQHDKKLPLLQKSTA